MGLIYALGVLGPHHCRARPGDDKARCRVVRRISAEDERLPARLASFVFGHLWGRWRPNAIAWSLPAKGRGSGDGGVSREPGWRDHALDHLSGVMSALFTSLVIGPVWMLPHVSLCSDFTEVAIQREAGMRSIDFWFDTTARFPVALLSNSPVPNCERVILAAILLHVADNIASARIGPEGDAYLRARLVVIGGSVLAVVRCGLGLVGGDRPVEPLLAGAGASDPPTAIKVVG